MNLSLSAGLESFIQDEPTQLERCALDVGLESYSLETLATELIDLRTTISKSGMAREDAAFLQNVDPELVTRPLNSYTELPSFTNVTPSVESIGSKLVELGKNLAKKILEFLKRLWNYVLKMTGFRKEAKEIAEAAYQKSQKADAVFDIAVEASVSPTVTAEEILTEIEDNSRVRQAKQAVEWSSTQFVSWIVEGNRIERFNDLSTAVHGLTGILQSALNHYKSLLNEPSVKQGAEVYLGGYAASNWETASGSRIIEAALERLEKATNRFGFKHPPRDRTSTYGANVVANISAVTDELKSLHTRPATREIPVLKPEYVDKLYRAIQSFEVGDPKLSEALERAVSDLEAVVNKPVSMSKSADDAAAKERMRLLGDYRQLIIDLLQVITRAQALLSFGMNVLVQDIANIARYKDTRIKATVTLDMGGRIAISEERKQAIIDFYEGRRDHVPSIQDMP